MLVERPDLLREWLTSTLKKISDADPDALGNYILALVKKDKKELKSFLLQQLKVFLENNTSKFVELLLETLLTKSYITKPFIYTVPDDAFIKLSSTVGEDIASSEPTTSVKSTKTDIKNQITKTDILKDKELKTKPTNESVADKFNSTSTHTHTENCGSLKRKNVFDDKYNSMVKETCKLPSCIYSKEELTTSIVSGGPMDVCVSEDKAQPNSSSKVEYTPERAKESKSDFISNLDPTPKKMKHDSTPHGDTDYRERKTVLRDLQSTTGATLLTENAPKQRESPTHTYKLSARCKDYDEKGFCLAGSFCPFDHGSDPILVENTPDEFLNSFNLTSLNFGGADKYEGTKSPFLPPLPTSPPSVPPPPPLPPPTDERGNLHPGFAGGGAEAYNPEAPGMHPHLNFFNPSKPPPQLPSMMPKSSMRMQSLYFGKTDPYNKLKSGRTRELINVTKMEKERVDSSQNNMGEIKDFFDRTYLKPLNICGTTTRDSINHTHNFKAKRFDFSRLGPCHQKTKLEIRKIPSKLNTKEKLLEHFSKFGKIVNIEIAFDNDPESAKISFSSNSEATAAYRSTDAILQNRFIKVFWTKNDVGEREEKRFSDVDTPPNFSKEINTRDFSSSLSPENLKGVSLDNITQLNDDRLFEDKMLDKVGEKNVLSKGIMPRSVYISNPLPQGGKVFPKLTVGAKKGTRVEEEIATRHKFKLHQAKNELLKNAIEHQKLILDQLMQTTKKKKKLFLRKALDNISKRVEDLTRELKKDNEDIKRSLLKKSSVAVSKIAAKELLDAELDLYKKQHTTHSDDDTTELLLKKVNLMKTKAKALGLIDSSGAPKSLFRRNIRWGGASLSIDHRPKNILVAGKNSIDKEDLRKHFKRFGTIEKLEEASGGMVISFYTRAEAEVAFIYGTKFDDNILSLSWLNDSQLNVNPTPDFNEKPEQKAKEVELLEVEDEEEEDEEEARSWRR